jgi:hypothetical protein
VANPADISASTDNGDCHETHESTNDTKDEKYKGLHTGATSARGNSETHSLYKRSFVSFVFSWFSWWRMTAAM